jgi:hypothetical protein
MALKKGAINDRTRLKHAASEMEVGPPDRPEGGGAKPPYAAPVKSRGGK